MSEISNIHTRNGHFGSKRYTLIVDNVQVMPKQGAILTLNLILMDFINLTGFSTVDLETNMCILLVSIH